MKYITIGQFCWGRDTDPMGSLLNCLREFSPFGGIKVAKFVTMECPDSTQVSKLDGSLQWDADDPEPKKYEEFEIPITLIDKFWDAYYEMTEGEQTKHSYGEEEA